jgi:lysyl-tRNA synthetase class 2
MSEEELYRARVEKLDALRARGIDPWPTRFDRSHTAAELQNAHRELAAGSESGRKVGVAGRLMSSRLQGKIAFGDLVDASGKIQLFVPEPFVEAFDALDVGDIVGASGEVIRTKRGELSVRVDDVVLLAKSLRSPPDKWHGIQDVELRYRQRYLDLLANPEALRIAKTRPHIVEAVRDFYDQRAFVEVETPILHPIFGGGYARPFTTHYNEIDADMFLRIATELYLKRLVIGGLERVYEIGRVFRNESVSFKHAPESTMLESYQAYADYLDVMDQVQSLVRTVAQETIGTTHVTFRGHSFDLAGEWRRVTMSDLVSEATNAKVSLDTPVDELREVAERHGLATEPWWTAGWLIGELYDKVAEHTIVEPTIVCDYPIEISPLARRHRDDERLTERFEVVVCAMELGNAFSELNDPIDQRARFEALQEARERGDAEASPMDEAFLRALEYGMPPTGGLGVGIDRLVMLLAGASSIREVILFPALRPETDEEKVEGPELG